MTLLGGAWDESPDLVAGWITIPPLQGRVARHREPRRSGCPQPPGVHNFRRVRTAENRGSALFPPAVVNRGPRAGSWCRCCSAALELRRHRNSGPAAPAAKLAGSITGVEHQLLQLGSSSGVNGSVSPPATRRAMWRGGADRGSGAPRDVKRRGSRQAVQASSPGCRNAPPPEKTRRDSLSVAPRCPDRPSRRSPGRAGPDQLHRYADGRRVYKKL